LLSAMHLFNLLRSLVMSAAVSQWWSYEHSCIQDQQVQMRTCAFSLLEWRTSTIAVGRWRLNSGAIV
jgi:hypothetical protein